MLLLTTSFFLHRFFAYSFVPANHHSKNRQDDHRIIGQPNHQYPLNLASKISWPSTKDSTRPKNSSLRLSLLHLFASRLAQPNRILGGPPSFDFSIFNLNTNLAFFSFSHPSRFCFEQTHCLPTFYSSLIFLYFTTLFGLFSTLSTRNNLDTRSRFLAFDLDNLPIFPRWTKTQNSAFGPPIFSCALTLLHLYFFVCARACLPGHRRHLDLLFQNAKNLYKNTSRPSRLVSLLSPSNSKTKPSGIQPAASVSLFSDSCAGSQDLFRLQSHPIPAFPTLDSNLAFSYTNFFLCLCPHLFSISSSILFLPRTSIPSRLISCVSSLLTHKSNSTQPTNVSFFACKIWTTSLLTILLHCPFHHCIITV